MYVVFGHPVKQYYHTTIISKATVFYILATVLTFIPPLLITYRSQGFWMRTASYREQPEIRWEQDLIVVLDTENPQRPIGWSTYQHFKDLLLDNIRVPRIESRERDWNRDGKYDGLEFKLEMPLKPHETVCGISIFMFFDVKLHRFSSVHFKGLAYLQSNTPHPLTGGRIDLTADLKMIQREPIAHKGRDSRFDEPIFDYNSIFADDYDFPSVLKAYSARNCKYSGRRIISPPWCQPFWA